MPRHALPCPALPSHLCEVVEVLQCGRAAQVVAVSDVVDREERGSQVIDIARLMREREREGEDWMS